MKKIMKRIGICIAALPFVAIILWIGFELVGMMVNSLAASKQTRQIQRNLQDAWQNVTIIDTYSETGKGTGNYVEMTSVIAFKVDEDLDEIIEKMSGGYEFNATDCWICELDVVIAYHEKNSGCYYFLDDMELPEDTEHCFIFVRNQPAPFADNIKKDIKRSFMSGMD